MEESEELFRMMADTAPVMIWIAGCDTHCYYFNRGWLEYTGRSLAEEIGNGWESGVHPEDLHSRRETYLAAFEARTKFQIEYRLRRASGEYGWVLDTGVPKFAPDGSVGYIGSCVDITERKLADAEIKESYSLLRTLIDSTPDAIVLKDIQGCYVLVNSAAANLLGKSEAEIIGKDDTQLLPLSVARSRIEADFRVITTQEPYTYENVVQVKNTTKTYLGTKSVYRDAAGNVAGLIGIKRDITKYKRIQQALENSEAKFQRLAANVPGMIYQFLLRPDNSVAFPYVNSSCREIYELEPEEIQQDATLVIAQIHPDDLASFQESVAVSAQTLQPWRWEGRFICPSGKLKWLQGASRPSKQVNGDILWDGLLMDISDRKRIEQDLRNSQQMLRLVIDNIPQLIFWKDRNSVYLGCNRNFAAIAGLDTPEDIVGLTDYNLPWKQEETDWFRECDRRVMETDTAEYNIIEPQLQADGKQAWVDTNKIPLHDSEGAVVGILGTVEDITVQKQAEEALRNVNEQLEIKVAARTTELSNAIASLKNAYAQMQTEVTERQRAEAELRALFAAMTDVILVLDAQGRYLKVAPTNPSLYYKPPAELLGKSVHEVFPQAEADFFLDHIQQAITTQQPVNFEYSLPIGDQQLWFTACVSPLQADNAILVARDITDRYVADQALRESEARLRLALKASKMAVWDWEVNTGKVTWSDGVESLFGLPSGLFGGTYKEFLKGVHPSDRKTVTEVAKTAIAAGTGYQVEHRILLLDGTVRWLWVNADVMRGDSGGALRMLGAVMDITDRKQAELERDRFFNISQDLLCIGDFNGYIKQLNSAWEKTLGWTREEITAVEFVEFVHPEDRAATSSHQVTKNAGTMEFENRYRCKDGSYKWLLWTSTTLPEEQLIYASARDITARKQAEEALKESESRFQTLVANVPGMIYQFRLLADGSPSFAYASPACRQIYELEPEQIQQNAALAIEQIHPDDLQSYHESGQAAVATGQTWRWEGRIIAPSGKVKWIQGSSRLSNQANGDAIADGLLMDISDRKQAEEALRQSEAQFRELALREELLNRLAGQIRASLELDTIGETAVQEIRNLLEIDRCDFTWYRPNAENPVWECIYEARNPELRSIIGIYPIAFDSPLIQKLTSLETLKVDDVDTCDEPLVRQELADMGYKSVLSLPVQTRSGEIGVLSCSSCTLRPWSDSEVQLLEAVTAQLAIAIDQAELYKQSRTAAQVATEQATQLERSLHELSSTQAALVQTEKMASLGQLVAGVAHEINNPINFIYGNLVHANSYTEDILGLLHLYQQHYPEPIPEIVAEIQAIDLEFLSEDLPKLLSSMKLGSDRIREIVLSLRNFSRIDEAEMKGVDIHQGIDSTLLILQNRLKAQPEHPEIEIIKQYGNLPQVECYAGQLNQVFMNLIANAVDALEEAIAKNLLSTAPAIRISTTATSNQIQIHIADNGVGMPEKVRSRLFDPFFTTKPIGKGTGLGLSISYQIVVEKHGGKLQCFSTLGQGTEFVIEIPITQSK